MNQKDLEQEVKDSKEALKNAVKEVENANFSLQMAFMKLQREEEALEDFINEQNSQSSNPY